MITGMDDLIDRCCNGHQMTPENTYVIPGTSKRRCRTCRNDAQVRRRLRHGPTYKTWAGMLSRCTNPNEEGFANYGGRGVSVCDRWRAFASFDKSRSRGWIFGMIIAMKRDEEPAPKIMSSEEIEAAVRAGKAGDGYDYVHQAYVEADVERGQAFLERLRERRFGDDWDLAYLALDDVIRLGCAPKTLTEQVVCALGRVLREST